MIALRRAAAFLGVDEAVVFAIAANVVIALTAPLILVMILWKLPPAQRGVFTNFTSVCQLQLLVELGIGMAMQQLAGRERAWLERDASGLFAGDAHAKARLGALLRISVYWFGAISGAAFALVLPVGWWFFSHSPGLDDISWQSAWVVTVVVMAVQGFLLNLLLFLNGCGDVVPVARVTATHHALSPLVQCTALVIGAGLYSHPVWGICTMLICTMWLLVARRRLLADLWSSAGKASFRWRSDVWPLQWRVSLTSVSLVVFLHLPPLIAMKFFGAVTAGQFGVSLLILMAIQATGAAWVSTKIPMLATLAAKRQWSEMDQLFRSMVVGSLSILGSFLGLVAVANYAIGFWQDSRLQSWAEAALDVRLQLDPASPTPLIDPLQFLLMGISILVIHVAYMQTAYLRAHNREPLLGVFVILVIAVTTTMIVAGALGSLWGMVIGYTFWVLVLGLGMCTTVFLICRRRWHR